MFQGRVSRQRVFAGQLDPREGAGLGLGTFAGAMPCFMGSTKQLQAALVCLDLCHFLRSGSIH